MRGGRRGFLHGVVPVLLAACAAERPPPPIPVDVSVPPGPGLRIALAWNAPVDLDLYVTDPAAETTYFANRTSRSGARLVRDARCEDVTRSGEGVEHVVVSTPMPGRYRIGVDFIDACGGRWDRVPYRLVVVDGDARRTVTGEVTLAAFEAVALEIEIGEQLVEERPAR